MSNASSTELVLVEPVPTPAPAQKTAGKPGPKPRDAAERALDRCLNAYRRAYDKVMEDCGIDPNDRDNEHLDDAKSVAEDYAREAYRKAMTLPSDYDSTSGFLVCVCHGVLMGTISAQESGQLLYAAQVATNLLGRAPKAENP